MYIKLFIAIIVLSCVFSCDCCEPDITIGNPWGGGEDPWSEIFLSTIDIDGDNVQHLKKNLSGFPKFSYDDNKIIIYDYDHNDFWILDTDGSNAVRVLESYDVNRKLFSVSPINHSIIFTSLGDIYKLDYMNDILTNLTISFEEQTWESNFSPDGLKIIFTTSPSISKIYTMNSDGSNIELIFQENYSDGRIYYPTFSDDMSKIFFIISYNGFCMCDADGTNIEIISSGMIYQTPIYSISRHVVFTTVLPYNVMLYNYNIDSLNTISTYAMYPNLSPNGDKIIYCSYTNPLTYPSNPSALYIVDIDGSNKKTLANPYNCYQSFSSDGEKIVFIREIVH